MALRHRYLSVDPFVSSSLATASRSGLDSVDFRSLAYLYYALRDRVVFEFVTGPIWNKWRSGSPLIDRAAFLNYVEKLSTEHPRVKRWRESTRIRLCQNVFTALRDFGLLKGFGRKPSSSQAWPSIPSFTFSRFCGQKAQGAQQCWPLPTGAFSCFPRHKLRSR